MKPPSLMHPFQKRVIAASRYEREKLFPNRGKRWTQAEDEILLRMTERGFSVWAAAEKLGRDPGGCKGRHQALKAGIKYALAKLL